MSPEEMNVKLAQPYSVSCVCVPIHANTSTIIPEEEDVMYPMLSYS